MVKQNLIIPISPAFLHGPTWSIRGSQRWEMLAATAFKGVIPDLHQGQGSALSVPSKQQGAQGLRLTCIAPEGQGEAVPAVSHGKGGGGGESLSSSLPWE